MPGFFTQALQGAVGACASGSTENRGLLTSQALLVSQASLGKQQAFVASCANAAVTRLLLCYRNWIPRFKAIRLLTRTQANCVATHGIVANASSPVACLELAVTPVMLQVYCALDQHFLCAASTF